MKKNVFRTIIAAVISVMLFVCWIPAIAEEEPEAEEETETEEEFEKGSRFNPYDIGDVIEFRAYESSYGCPWIDVEINFNEITLSEKDEQIYLHGALKTGAASTDDEAIYFDFFMDTFTSDLEEVSMQGQTSADYPFFSYTKYNYETTIKALNSSDIAKLAGGYLRFLYFASEEDIMNDAASYFWVKLPNEVEIPEEESETETYSIDKYGAVIYKKALTATAVNGANVRSIPSQDGDIIGTITPDTQVAVLGETELWYMIDDDGLVGYVNKNLFEID